MRKSFFFGLCFIASVICTAPLAVLIDANGINPLAHPPFMAGVLAMVMSTVGFCGTLFTKKF